MKKKFIKSKMRQVHEFMSSYSDTFYIEDVLKDDKIDINMKGMFIISECELSRFDLKKFAIGYSKLMPQDKSTAEAIHLSELYMEDRMTIKQLQNEPMKILQNMFSSGTNFESMPKLAMLLYYIHNEDQMFYSYIHLITSGCSYYLQGNDSDKVLQYFKDFVSAN